MGDRFRSGYMEVQMKRGLRFALISLLLCAPAHAQDGRGVDQRDIEVGNTLVCDTQEPAERYITHFKGDTEAVAPYHRRDRISKFKQ
jgi:hypothetical protein